MISDIYLHVRINHEKNLPGDSNDRAKVLAAEVERRLWVWINAKTGQSAEVTVHVDSAAVSNQ